MKRFPHRTGYTLVEMLVTVAALIIVLGLMVSLARDVRERSAVALTRELLRQLDGLASQYESGNAARSLPPAPAFPPPIPAASGVRSPAGQSPGASPLPASGPSAPPAASGPTTSEAGAPDDLAAVPDESRPAIRRALRGAALANNRAFVAAFRRYFGRGGAFDQLPRSAYDESESVILDAWGSPIVLMPKKHPAVGTAPNGRYFFFSAGPDRQYLTQDDNLYSYEDLGVKGPGPE